MQDPIQDPNDVQHEDPFATDSGADAFAEQREFERRTASQWQRLKLGRTNLLLAGLFAAGIGALYLLSLRGGPRQASAHDVAVEQEVTEFIERASTPEGQEQASQTRRIVEEFYNYAARVQVPLRELRANPFAFRAPAAPDGPERQTEDAAEAQRRQQVEAARRELATLRLQSILMGSGGGTAIVNNTFVRAGERIGSFTVTAVDARTVTLEAQGETFTLEMAQ